MIESLLSVRQVAILLKVHPLTVRRYIKDGKLKAIKAAGNIRIPQGSVDSFAQAIYPTSYGIEKTTKFERSNVFAIDDPIFRLKGRSMSLKADF